MKPVISMLLLVLPLVLGTLLLSLVAPHATSIRALFMSIGAELPAVQCTCYKKAASIMRLQLLLVLTGVPPPPSSHQGCWT